MAQIVYTNIQEDYQKGEILSRTYLKKECKNQEMFIRTYIQDIALLAKCSGAEQSVVLCCLKYLDYATNSLSITGKKRTEIAECSGLKANTVNTAIARLVKKNIFIKRGAGEYLLNPTLFFFGSDIDRNKLFELKIQYIIRDTL